MKINDRHIQCIELLLKGIKPKLICEELGIEMRTLRKWKTDQDFDFELQMMKDELKGRMFHKMLSLHDLAHKETLTILMGNDTSAKTKILPLVYSNIWNTEKITTTEQLKKDVKFLKEKLGVEEEEEEED